MKKAGKIIGIILLGMVVIMNIFTAVRNLTGTSDEFSLLPFTLLTVETGSMEPDLSVGDLIIDREIPYDDLQIGDIISFRLNDEIITHRLIRFEGSRLVTKGTANNAEDKSIGPDEYLGKVVAVLPGMGVVLSYLRNPVSLFCLLIVIFGLFYMPGIVLSLENRSSRDEKGQKEPAAEAVKAEAAEAEAVHGENAKPAEETQKESARRRQFGYRDALRLSGFLAAASFLLLTPTMTEAKYAVIVNGRAALAADYRYMDSNLLEDAGTVVELSGWTGKSYTETVSVKNSENLLKYNKQGQDLTYRFLIKKITSRGNVTYRTDYTLTIDPQAGITEASEAKAAAFTYSPAMTAEIGSGALNADKTYVLTGRNDSPNADYFTVTVTPDASYALGDKISFKIYAMTSYSDGYYFCKTAEVILTASQSGEFVINRTKNTFPGNRILTYRFQTALYDGAEVRDVIVRWDSTQVTLNEYEGNAYEIIHNRQTAGSYFAGSDTDHSAYLILPLSAYTTVNLEFFKASVNSDGTDIDITAEVRNTDASAQ